MSAVTIGSGLVASVLGIIVSFFGLNTVIKDDNVLRFIQIATLIIGVSVLVLAAFSIFSKKSFLKTPNRFDFRVRSRDELKGRDEDEENLAHLVLVQSHLVFLDGESGCGKSSLIRHGLKEQINRKKSTFAVCIDQYPEGWDGDLEELLVESIRLELDGEQLRLLKSHKEKSVGEILDALIDDINGVLALTPILIFDQFDDYQLANKREFIDDRNAWISPQQLTAKSRVWKTIAAALNARKIKVVFVTRSDARAGLDCVRFSARAKSKTLSKLNQNHIGDVMDLITGKGDDVIGHPGHGWQTLRKQLESDLAQGNHLLPQQLRVVFLGLRSLRNLTVSDYQRAGGAAGVEALYIQQAIKRVVTRGFDDSLVREVLNLFVDADDMKTLVVQEDALTQKIPDADRMNTLVAALIADEILRETHQSVSARRSWRLDHDYLAKAIVNEAMMARRFIRLLHDTHQRWNSRSNVWQFYDRLLPVRDQARILFHRVFGHRGERFTYGQYRPFAVLSLLRLVPVVMAATLCIAVINYRDDVVAAEQIGEEMISAPDGDQKAVIKLWRAPPEIRSKFPAYILARVERLKKTQPGWVAAYIGLDPKAAQGLTHDIEQAMARQGFDQEYVNWSAPQLEKIATYLTVDDNRRLTVFLRKQFDNSATKAASLIALAPALSKACRALPRAEAQETTKYLLTKALQIPMSPETADTRIALSKATAHCANVLRGGEINDIYAMTYQSLKSEKMAGQSHDMLAIVGAMAAELSPAMLDQSLEYLLQKLEVADAELRRNLLSTLSLLAPNLSASQAELALDFLEHKLVTTPHNQRDDFVLDSNDPHSAYITVIGDLSARIPGARLRETSLIIAKLKAAQCKQKDIQDIEVSGWAQLIGHLDPADKAWIRRSAMGIAEKAFMYTCPTSSDVQQLIRASSPLNQKEEIELLNIYYENFMKENYNDDRIGKYLYGEERFHTDDLTSKSIMLDENQRKEISYKLLRTIIKEKDKNKTNTFGSPDEILLDLSDAVSGMSYKNQLPFQAFFENELKFAHQDIDYRDAFYNSIYGQREYQLTVVYALAKISAARLERNSLTAEIKKSALRDVLRYISAPIGTRLPYVGVGEREAQQDFAWEALEKYSGKTFNKNHAALMAWAETVGITPEETRLPPIPKTDAQPAKPEPSPRR